MTAAEQRLLDAARGEFERYGVRRTTMDDIARRAGVSRSTLYRRYPTKDALFEQLALVDSAELFGQLDQLAKGRDPQSAVIDCFTAGVRLVHEMPLARAILESEPELLVGLATRTKSLPILQAAERVAGSLRRSGVTMPDDDLRAVSEILVRLTMSLLLNPGGQLELSDSAAVRRYAERYLARMVW